MAFPGTRLDRTVEVALGADLTADPSTWVWTTANAYVRERDPFRITRGGFDGGLEIPPSSMTFTADNRDGRWCSTNPTGAWYGQLGQGTPVRLVVDEGTSSVRFTGFIAALPPRWDPSERDRYVPVTAAGVTRRLGRGRSPLRSALVRAIVGTYAPPVAYWPAEDESGATTLAEYFGGSPMTWQNTLTLASAGPDGSAPLPEFTSVAGVTGNVPGPRTSVGQWTVMCVINFPAAPTAPTTVLRWYTSGTLPRWQLVLAPGSPDTIALEAYDTAGTRQINEVITFASSLVVEPYGTWVMIAATAGKFGSGVYWGFGVGDDTGFAGASALEVDATTGVVTSIGVPASAKLDGVHAGHFAVWDDGEPVFQTLTSLVTAALDGHSGETVAERVARLSTEEGIGVHFTGVGAQLMGPQARATFLTLLRDAEDVDGGRLFDHRDPVTFGALLRFAGRSAITNRAVNLALDHDQGHVAVGFEPTDDDQMTRNDWTITRRSGSTGRVVDEDGPLGVDTVGRYDDAATLNLATDDQPVHQAGWRVNLGTVAGLRFPQLALNLARSPGLITDWVACDIGSRVTVANPPAGMAPDDIDVLIEGYTETLDAYRWDVVLNCSPYRPFIVGELADTPGGAHTTEVPADGDEDEGTAVVMGTTLVFASAGVVTAVSFYVPVTNTGTYTVGLFRVDTDDAPAGTGTGTLLASASVAAGSVTAGARATVTIASTAVDTTHAYRAAVHSSSGRFVRTAFGFDVASGGITSGDVTAIESGTDPVGIGLLHNGTYLAGAALAYPVNMFEDTDYHVDVVFTSDVDVGRGRLAGDPDAAIRTAIDADDLSVGFDPNRYRWTTAADDFDPDLRVRLGGEVISVSTIGTNVAAFVAAGAAAHADNAAVTPVMFAGATIRRLILVLAAIRPTLSGSLITPTGYTRLPVFAFDDNVQLYAKVSDGAEADPTVTPSGGAAGNTVSAFTFGFSNMPSTLDDLGDVVVDSAELFNAVSQDIAFPGVYPSRQRGCVLLIVGWKQSDFTSIAVPSGFTEILEASTTVGSDQGLYAAYKIQTTPALVDSGSLVVTGGVSAASRGAVVAIAGGFQDLTISARSLNGVVKSHLAGTRIEVEDPFVLSL